MVRLLDKLIIKKNSLINKESLNIYYLREKKRQNTFMELEVAVLEWVNVPH